MTIYLICMLLVFSLSAVAKGILLSFSKYPRQAEVPAWADVADLIIYLLIVLWTSVMFNH